MFVLTASSTQRCVLPPSRSQQRPFSSVSTITGATGRRLMAVSFESSSSVIILIPWSHLHQVIGKESWRWMCRARKVLNIEKVYTFVTSGSTIITSISIRVLLWFDLSRGFLGFLAKNSRMRDPNTAINDTIMLPAYSPRRNAHEPS